MELPSLKHLSYLVALHQHQHFHRAASACFISQSTLSSAILKLEEQLNCQLLERDHKTFSFTVTGEEVVRQAKQLIVQATELKQFAQYQGKIGCGSVTIGCIPTVAPYLLSSVSKACQVELPNLELFLIEDTTENLLLKLADGSIDIALLALPVTGHNFRTKVLGQDPFYIAGEQRLVDRFLETQDYQQVPEASVFLLSKEHCLTEHALSACRLGDQSRIHKFSSSSLATLVEMTAFHQGFTFLPKMAVDQGVGTLQGLTIKPLPDDMYRDIGMLWRDTSLRTSTYLKFGEVVASCLA
ncbi:hydrogen peroxide-inducible genes activator [Thalassotalea sp. LPB0316]|uniref:hydrogen peroxide-inducible genes activator n=1 Tax=Thalassotalea sp. LPB0316 TaxID=2769490 RepID=UPI001D03D241|nr:hydrogen peroxide-inducible genes activator [Thalassotalea sp. LPB0316]